VFSLLAKALSRSLNTASDVDTAENTAAGCWHQVGPSGTAFPFVFPLFAPFLLPSPSFGTYPCVLTASLATVQGLEGQEREEVEWGEVLHVVYSGLVATRRLLWDESERKIIALLSSSSAFEGDHFLQVRASSHRPAFTQSICMHPNNKLLVA